MKTNFKMMAITLSLLATTTFSVSYAKATGGDSGGGGDASEARVDEIREDILRWIENGGAKGLKLPSELKYNDYFSKMKEILEPQKVVVKFVEKDDETNEELKVNVNGSPKTCRGFYSKIDGLPNILCSIPRFAATTDSEQYKLIHHEFAGLVNVEKNDKAASDYSLSSQLTEYLSEQTVLKLALKKVEANKACAIYSADLIKFKSSKLDSENLEKAKEIESLFSMKGYKFVTNESNASIIAKEIQFSCEEYLDQGTPVCYVARAGINLVMTETHEEINVFSETNPGSWFGFYTTKIPVSFKKPLRKVMAQIPQCIK